MSEKRERPFFVGYLSIPGGLRGFLSVAAVILIAGFAVLGWAVGASQDDPGPGAFRFDFGRQTVIGVVELRPYPLLRVTEGSEHIKVGHTLMLAAAGKRGLIDRAAPLDGKLAKASGVLLSRGDLDMLQVRGGAAGLSATPGNAPAMDAESLGRWRLAGESCDGKCLAGAMRPDRGLAHKACANLCLIGGVPPIFVSTQPIDGQEFLLIAGPDGGPLPQSVYDHVAAFIEIEGEVERRGDMLVFQVDPATIKIF